MTFSWNLMIIYLSNPLSFGLNSFCWSFIMARRRIMNQYSAPSKERRKGAQGLTVRPNINYNNQAGIIWEITTSKKKKHNCAAIKSRVYNHTALIIKYGPIFCEPRMNLQINDESMKKKQLATESFNICEEARKKKQINYESPKWNRNNNLVAGFIRGIESWTTIWNLILAVIFCWFILWKSIYFTKITKAWRFKRNEMEEEIVRLL